MSSDREPDEFDFVWTTERKQELVCMAMNARRRLSDSAKEQNQMAFNYYSGALAALVDVLGIFLNEAYEPDGSETPKP